MCGLRFSSMCVTVRDMQFKTIIFSFVFVLVSHAAQATTWNENDRYWATYNFSSQAFGKTVQTVYAHTGVARGNNSCGQMYGTAGAWDNVQHIQMTKIGDHFFAKATLTSGTSECSPSVLGPVVQYWVYFTDGSQMVTDTVSVPFTETTLTAPGTGPGSSYMDSFDASSELNDKAFAKVTDATTTDATHLSYEYAD